MPGVASAFANYMEVHQEGHETLHEDGESYKAFAAVSPCIETHEGLALVNFEKQIEELRGEADEQSFDIIKFRAMLDLILVQVSQLTREMVFERACVAELRQSIDSEMKKAIDDTKLKLLSELQAERCCRELLAGELQGLQRDIQMQRLDFKKTQYGSASLAEKMQELQQTVQMFERTMWQLEHSQKLSVGHVSGHLTEVLGSLASIRLDTNECTRKVHGLETAVQDLKDWSSTHSSKQTAASEPVSDMEAEGTLERQLSELTLTLTSPKNSDRTACQTPPSVRVPIRESDVLTPSTIRHHSKSPPRSSGPSPRPSDRSANVVHVTVKRRSSSPESPCSYILTSANRPVLEKLKPKPLELDQVDELSSFSSQRSFRSEPQASPNALMRSTSAPAAIFSRAKLLARSDSPTDFRSPEAASELWDSAVEHVRADRSSQRGYTEETSSYGAERSGASSLATSSVSVVPLFTSSTTRSNAALPGTSSLPKMTSSLTQGPPKQQLSQPRMSHPTATVNGSSGHSLHGISLAQFAGMRPQVSIGRSHGDGVALSNGMLASQSTRSESVPGFQRCSTAAFPIRPVGAAQVVTGHRWDLMSSG